MGAFFAPSPDPRKQLKVQLSRPEEEGFDAFVKCPAKLLLAPFADRTPGGLFGRGRTRPDGASSFPWSKLGPHQTRCQTSAQDNRTDVGHFMRLVWEGQHRCRCLLVFVYYTQRFVAAFAVWCAIVGGGGGGGGYMTQIDTSEMQFGKRFWNAAILRCPALFCKYVVGISNSVAGRARESETLI